MSLGLGVTIAFVAAMPPQNRIERALAAFDTLPPTAPRARGAIRQTLTIDGLDVRVVRAAALSYGLSGELERAHELMTLAGRASRRDTDTQVWLMSDALARGHHQSAFHHMDLVLRRRPDYMFASQPTVARLLITQPGAAESLASVLKGSPPWRQAFVEALGSGADMNAAWRLLAAMRRSGVDPTAEELFPLFSALVERQDYATTRRALAELAPYGPTLLQHGVYDGGFDSHPPAAPFGWREYNRSGATVSAAAAPERANQQALHVRYDGFSAVELTHQLLVLPPGSYVLRAEYRAADIIALQHLKWRVRCRDTALDLVQVQGDTDGGWQKLQARFEVPAVDCGAQLLELVALPGGRRSDVDVWFDSVSVTRLKVAA